MVIYGCRNGRKGMHGTVSKEVQIWLGRAREGFACRNFIKKMKVVK
jgi:hypothetical protein